VGANGATGSTTDLHHFYDGALLPRPAGFMAQFGLSPFPRFPRVDKANIKDDPVVQSNHRDLSPTRCRPNTRTTQVFINFGNNERLDKDGFAPFGWSDGMEVVAAVQRYGEGAPRGPGPDQGLIGNQGRTISKKCFRN